MRLYLIRHAEPAYPDDALTDAGHRQARRLAERLAGLGLDRLVSSPMRRARDTARYTAERTGLEVEVEEWLAELESWLLGDSEEGEAPAWEIPAAVVRRRVDLHSGNWHTLVRSWERGRLEAFEGLQRSSDALLARFGCRRTPDGWELHGSVRALAAFCHTGLALTWLAHLLRIPPPLVWAGFTLAPASVTLVEFEQGAGGGAQPRCLLLGDTSHLR